MWRKNMKDHIDQIKDLIHAFEEDPTLGLLGIRHLVERGLIALAGEGTEEAKKHLRRCVNFALEIERDLVDGKFNDPITRRFYNLKKKENEDADKRSVA